jgi:arginase
MADAAGLPLPYPEVASIVEETLAAQSLVLAASLPQRPLVLGGCCCAHVGAVEGLAAQHERLGVVWIDAHGDLNTVATSPSGNAWGMPLRMLLDAGTIEVPDVVLIGARNLDQGEEEFIAETGLALGTDAMAACLRAVDAVYVAFDCDALDPGEGVSVFMPEPNGLALNEAERLLARIVEARPLAGAGLTGLVADERAVPGLMRLCAALGL